MKVLAHYAWVEHETEKAVLIRFKGPKYVWLPKWAYKPVRRNLLETHERFLIDTGVERRCSTNIPEPIEPVLNQDAIDELKFDPNSGG